MKILVTGGAGFIGSNFIFYMLNKHPAYRIVCYDSLTYAGNLKTLASINNANFKFIRGDITDASLVDSVFSEEQFDIIVNFAAETHVDRSIVNPGVFLKTNTIGTQVLMDAGRAYNVKRFHQISTDEVYGDLPLDKPEMLFTEQTPLNPSSPYSASKAGADLLVLSYYRTYRLPVTISRCSNNYGSYQYPEKLIPYMIISALHNKALPVYGTGDNVRDWLHVDDHCAAVDLILHNGRDGEVYNIGGNNERVNLQVVQTILKEMNKPESLIKFVTDRAGHDKRYAIDATKIETELGWTPKMQFSQGIKKTIEWYVNNTQWWSPLLKP